MGGIIMLILIIILGVLGIIFIILSQYAKEEPLFAYAAGIFVTITVWLISNYKKPEAMDVYRGKTELQIKGYYQEDSTFVVTDSTVVFKK